MVEIYIYINGQAKRIELFNDEKISLTSSIQNINDISKVFTDYSQSFTVPASNHNNTIFRHWYESALDNGFDQRIRYRGFIKIDTKTFRSGKWQLESASIKDGKIENYKITFYGELKSLTDKFGEDRLKDITQLNDYTINYTGANVQTTITTVTDRDLMFPLISSARAWQSGGGTSNDITISANAISYLELFPALKISKIFEAIKNKYGVTFNGSFLNDKRFTKAYLWLKNREANNNNLSTQQLINYTTIVNDNSQVTINADNFNINSTFTLIRLPAYPLDRYAATISWIRLNLTLSVSTNWQIIIFKDGVQQNLQSGVGTSILLNLYPNEIGNYKLYIRTATACTYNGTLDSRQSLNRVGFSTAPSNINRTSTAIITGSIATVNLDIPSFMPDMKVSDFFSGILKMFNLTAFSENGTDFTLQQLESWYYQGNIKDFSQYCTTDVEISRVKPYKKINFEYEKSESLLNKKFAELNGREYGNLSYEFNNDGSDYAIKLPFENIMFNKFTGTNLQVAYTLNTDLTTYVPKPIIIYRNEYKPCNFYFNTGVATNLISTYNVFGQELNADGLINTLNWGIEISPFYLTPISNTLFNNYYLAYLNNLYSLKSRMVKVKMQLPKSELLNLKLNDRIKIRNKRYIINQYTTDLTTLESDFELIQDFRSINFNNSGGRQINNEAQTIEIEYVQDRTWTIANDEDGIIINFVQRDSKLIIEIKANVSGVERVAIFTNEYDEFITIIQDA